MKTSTFATTVDLLEMLLQLVPKREDSHCLMASEDGIPFLRTVAMGDHPLVPVTTAGHPAVSNMIHKFS